MHDSRVEFEYCVNNCVSTIGHEQLISSLTLSFFCFHWFLFFVHLSHDYNFLVFYNTTELFQKRVNLYPVYNRTVFSSPCVTMVWGKEGPDASLSPLESEVSLSVEGPYWTYSPAIRHRMGADPRRNRRTKDRRVSVN